MCFVTYPSTTYNNLFYLHFYAIFDCLLERKTITQNKTNSKKKPFFPAHVRRSFQEKAMLAKTLIRHLPEPNDDSIDALRHYYSLRLVAYDLLHCPELPSDEVKRYTKMFVVADLCYRLARNDDLVEEYDLPSLPPLPVPIEEVFYKS